MITQMGVSGTIFGSGDLICQLAIHPDNTKLLHEVFGINLPNIIKRERKE